MEIPRVSPHGHVPELFSMAKPHVKELWMLVFGLGESPAEVGNGMPEHKHTAIPEATNAINQFWW